MNPVIVSDPRPGSGVALVGYRGTGKSTVGRLLAERLNRPFQDADHALEARAGRSIREIFAEHGEPAFRDEEEATLRELVEQSDLVLATGGGVILRESNRALLRQFGTVVWLTANEDVLGSRLCTDDAGLRPALTQAGLLAEIATVLKQRTPLYREVADLVVDTSQKTPFQVVDEILRSIEAGRAAAQEARS
jgi:shikimate kinase